MNAKSYAAQALCRARPKEPSLRGGRSAAHARSPRRVLTSAAPHTACAAYAVAALCLALIAAAPAWGLPEGQPDRSWEAPEATDVRRQALEWLAEQAPEEDLHRQAEAIWQEEPPRSSTEVLECLAATFALGDARARRLVELCAAPRGEQIVVPSQPWLFDPQTPPLLAHNLRLLFGRWLVHEAMYDEALEQLGDLAPEEVADPATLLFYQAVVHHRLLEKDRSIESLRLLLEGERAAPRRYVALAELMREDLEGLRDETLDHIARRMEDIGRRLSLGRAGERVRRLEDGVIESLDKLIEEIEDARQQAQQAGGGASAGGIQSSAPAPDSMPLGGGGPGEVDRRDLGDGSGWGDLPPREREEALQEIGREFPAHYRDVIEQYFRRLAAGED